LAYDNELGGRMWVGAIDRRLFNLSLEGSSAVRLGEFRKELYLGFRRYYQVGQQLMTPTLSARIASESVRHFDVSGNELDAVDTREALGFLGIERAFDPTWQIELGIVGHDWHEPGRDLATLGGRGKITKLGRSHAQLFDAELLWTGVYQRATVAGEATVKVAGLRLRPRLRLGWGNHLPVQAMLPLGGDDGFPGLHLGEPRGDREGFASVLLTYGLKGPFVGRLEIAAGRSAIGGAFLDKNNWRAGARAGIGADTPVGPIRFEYGVTTIGRGAFFVRLGQWF
jgi:hypothetical protein